MRTVLFVAALFVAVCVGQAPPIPFPQLHLMFKRTVAFAGGNQVSQGYGAVDNSLKSECVWDDRTLPIANSTESLDVNVNYTTGVEQIRWLHDDGLATNCSSVTFNQTWSDGGRLFFPSVNERATMKFVEYGEVNHKKVAIYTGKRNVSEGVVAMLNWTIFAEDKIPLSFSVWDVLNNASRLTTLEFAFVKAGELPGRCRSALTCGEKVCVAKPQASAAALQGALAWTCGQISCAPIQQSGPSFYPNTIEAHTTWAFQAYYESHKSIDGDDACNFSGLGLLTVCQVNTTCVVRPTATEVQLDAALKWLCSPAGLQDCAPIMPGGLYFFPNTTVNHANWAFNAYYQPYKCVPGWNPCDFNGAAEIVANF